MKSHKQVQAATKFTYAEIRAVLLGPDHLAHIAMHRPSIQQGSKVSGYGESI
jgi:hypothetical protein